MKKLNITNGDSFNEYFCTTTGEDAIPFREAMMDGDAFFDIFSDKFIEARALCLNVSKKEYMDKAVVLKTLKSNGNAFSEIVLWFGKDTFCQMNLLTLLAFIEQIGYFGKVTLNYIDDANYNIIQNDIDVKLGIYKRLYDKILVQKVKSKAEGVILQNTIDLYFDYLSPDGELQNIIKDNPLLDDFSLICLLLEKSENYGLSDLQAKNLIKKYRK